jgi:hypothetical protein
MDEELGIIIAETKLRKYTEQDGNCGHCGNELERPYDAELAHRIPQTKLNLKKFGKKVIHHDINLVLVCSKRCNSGVLIDNKPVRKAQVISQIQESLKE